MRTPPPVVVTLGPDAAWRALWVLLPSLAAACAGLWLALIVAHRDTGTSGGMGSLWREVSMTLLPLAGALVVGWAGWQTSHNSLARLTWTGNTWRLTPIIDPALATHEADLPSEGHTCEPDLMIDLGHWLLLRVRWHDDKPQEAWWAISARTWAAGDWHGLCVALQGGRLASGAGAPTSREERPEGR